MVVGHAVVVGASLGGLRTAQSLRSVGFEGRITLVGDEIHAPYNRPPLSKQVLAGEWEPERTALTDDAGLAKLDMDLRLGQRATDLDLADRSIGLHGGERIGFDALVVATGASPRRLPDTPAVDGIHLLRTLDDAIALGAALDGASRLVVVGAGFIGAEVAATARGRGLEVTLLEALPVPLSRGLGPVLGPAVAAIHGDHGVDLRCAAAVAGIEGEGRVERVLLSDGSTVEADLVVVGIGVAPNTEWLEGSGLELRDGVVCDELCQAVGAPGVWAVGDVARWHNPLFEEEMRVEHWTNAVDQARSVASNIAGVPVPYAPVPYVWSDQYGSKIQVLGRPGAADEVEVASGSLEERRFVALTHRDDRLTAVVGLDEPRMVMRFMRLLSAHSSSAEARAFAAAYGPDQDEGGSGTVGEGEGLSDEEQQAHRRAVADLMPTTPFLGWLGVVIDRYEPDDVVVRLPFRTDLTNDGTYYHGGVVASVIDTAGAAAAWSAHDFDRGTRASTIAMSLQYVGACKRSDLVCRARTVRRAKELIFTEIAASDSDGNPVAHAVQTYRIV